MKNPVLKALVLTIGFVFVISIAGCEKQNLSNTKQTRLIAAENSQLKKELEQRDKKIERQEQLHSKEIKKQKELLDKCLQENKALQEKMQKGIREQLESVLGAAIEENAKLREENKKLKAQVQELEKELQELKQRSVPKEL